MFKLTKFLACVLVLGVALPFSADAREKHAPNVSEIQIQKQTNSASPKLSSTGKVKKDTSLTVRKAGKDQGETYRGTSGSKVKSGYSLKANSKL